MSAAVLEKIIAERKMVICVGPGGVGKTTFAASLAVRAAQLGKNVACLTIDPAKRLGDVLGIGSSEASDTASSNAAAGALRDITPIIDTGKCRGTLHMGMLDAKETFDDVVRQKSSSPDRVDKILHNKLYRYVSGSLSGMQEYMALERLCQLQENEQYDLIVLDTPPSDNVVDFFTAPLRMKNALDGPLVRMMRKVYGERSHGGFDLLGRWAMSVFNVLARITGASLLDEIMEFVDALSDLFGNFSVRAAQIEQMLGSRDVAVLMVTRPDEASAKETTELQRELEVRGYHVDGLVFNQCTYPLVNEPVPMSVDECCRTEMTRINHLWNEAYEREAKVIDAVRKRGLGFDLVCIIPLIPIDVTQVETLSEIWRSLQPADKMSVQS